MYIIGFTRSCPVLAPTVCRRSTGAPSNGPPTLPSLARNSSIILLFQSDISGVLFFLSCAFGRFTRLVPNSAQAGRCRPPLGHRQRSTATSRGFFPPRKQRPDPAHSPPRPPRSGAHRRNDQRRPRS